MNLNEQKIVEFGKYCPRCKYYLKPENEDPCCECLDTPTNAWTHKPINFKKREVK